LSLYSGIIEGERNELTIMYDSVIKATTLREAWKQGLQQGLIQVALNMLQEKIDLAQVAKLTGLSLEQIQSLQASDLDDSQALVKDFLELSQSSLNKIWLDPEEDEAWKDL
jgi:DNA-binding phage protein